MTEGPRTFARDPSNRLAQLFQEAAERHARGELEDAARLYHAVLAGDPQSHQVYERLGDIRARQGRTEDALKLLRRALKLQPNSAFAAFNLANILRSVGQLDEAKAHYEQAVALKPDFSEAHNNLAIVLHALKDFAAAVAHCERALALKPDNSMAHNNLGNMLQALSRGAEARTHYEAALRIRPDYPEAHNNLGNVLQMQSRFEEAKACYERALTLRPDYAEAHNNLGNALHALGQHHAAKACYEKALALKSDYADAHANVAIVLHLFGDHERAIAHCQRALTLRPDYPEAYNNLGNALYGLNRCEEAVVAYRRALALRPDYPEAHDNLGLAQEALGRVAEARRSFETAIALTPKRGLFYRNLSECTTFAPDDPHLRAMELLAAEADALPPVERINLHFALGSALADVADYERSFEHLLAGNALKRKEIVYDEKARLAAIDRIRAVFTPELVRAKAGLGEPSTVPVFILGMPRSGSTLIEQVLAGHPDVHAAGELDDFDKIVQRVRRADRAPITYPEIVAQLDGVTLRAIGKRYADGVRIRSATAARITDKMPGNALLVGLIHLALPQARIIHTRRDAVDTCLSCFSKLFREGQLWSYDLAELGRYYRAYAATMAHWRSVLPAETMLEIRYEEVVADLEGQARRILAYCGLPWSETCLDFHRTQRPVKTASAAQVRRPLYQSSVGRARAYGERLRPLLDALGPDLVGSCG